MCLLRAYISAIIKQAEIMTEFPAAGTTVIEKNELLSLIPHKGKMLLISRVTEYDTHARILCSEYDVGEDCIFYDPVLRGVPGWLSFEFMAQAVSTLSGITGKILGKPPMIGFILSVSSMEIKIPLLRPGDVVKVRVTEELRLGMNSTFRCTAFAGEAEAAQARLMLMDVEDPMEFIEKNDYGK